MMTDSKETKRPWDRLGVGARQRERYRQFVDSAPPEGVNPDNPVDLVVVDGGLGDGNRWVSWRRPG